MPVIIAPAQVVEDRTSASGGLSAILADVGEAAYEWDIAADRLSWHGDVEAVLKVPAHRLGSNAEFGRFLDSGNMISRYETVFGAIERDVGGGVAYQIQYGFNAVDADCGVIWVEDTGRWFADASGKPMLARGVVRAINDRHAREQRLAYLSRYDELTSQMNRTHFLEVLESVLANTKRYDTTGSLLLASIDNLGKFNDTYGFDVADQMIAAVADRLKAELRQGDMLGRVSGNRFAIMLNNCADDNLELTARRLRMAVRGSVVETAAGPVSATISLGGLTFPRHATTMRQLMTRCQEALEDARKRGTDGYSGYRASPARESAQQENLRQAARIVSAVEDDRFRLVLQPVIDLETGKAAFHECLLRLRDEDGTLGSAGDMIVAGQRLGLMHLIDRRVLDLSIGLAIADPTLVFSVNVSAGACADSDWLAAMLGHVLRRPDIAERMIVEITESMAIEDLETTREFVERVREAGCRVAIDDFGAGYTSFRNLRQLEVDMVKIDGSFVRDFARSTEDQAFVKALLALASELSMDAVAEWVEDERDLAQLRQIGVRYVQGFAVGEPFVPEPADAVARERETSATSEQSWPEGPTAASA